MGITYGGAESNLSFERAPNEALISKTPMVKASQFNSIQFKLPDQ